MPTNWDDIAKKAADTTDKELADLISGLTRLNNNDIDDLLQTGISQKNLAEVLKIVKDSTISNEAKAKSIKSIAKGLDVLIAIGKKLI